MIRNKIASIAAAGVLMAFVTASRAAEPAAPAGSVTGKVTGVDGKAAGGVTVRLAIKAEKLAKGEDKAAKRNTKAAGMTATTDAAGQFKVEHVPAGAYVVTARSTDGNRAKGDVTVIVGKAAESNLTLEVAKGKKAKKNT